MTELAVFKDERKRTFLNAEGSDMPLKSPLGQDVLDRARAYRLQRLRDEMTRQDVAGLLLYDPVNIRYAFDCSNMSIWTAHNPIRYALILNGGPGIMFEFKGCEHLNDGLPGIDEVRNAIGWMFMCAGDKATDRLTPWAAEIADLVRQYCGGNLRLGVDRMEPEGVHALSEHGLQIIDGGQITETARAIKSADEIELMRWTIRVCEAGMARIYDHSVPGVTEQELWAHLHFENARSGGEWLETKLLTCGPNTNPWYKECSARECRAGEMISFDTDMIGPYGYCADLSRSWTCGYAPMSDTQKRLYAAARAQIEHNMALLQPGLSFAEFNAKSWQIPTPYQPYRYSLAAHGVGMADEWPVVPLHVDFAGAHGGCFEENMVICIESLIGEDRSESVKLETQVLVTADGPLRLDSFPWEM
ncbi:M24 family metallopeptidase [Leisingera sp. ANG-S5]|uniref:M24 family metallopeptidase n=1 Tax=Leisingera sp. ANG-S5 TaxID=1577901 RepID=UPI00057E1875|nr:Xaa-Pro peptidase family protein [Leisingera sp. ANG-S5]KIC34362.1 peptidase M24 [Leisingera sp. ANG-S5]